MFTPSEDKLYWRGMRSTLLSQHEQASSRAFYATGRIRLREDAFVGESSHDSSPQYPSGCVSMPADLDNWQNRFVEDIRTASPARIIWRTSAYATDVFPLNAPYGSPHMGLRAVGFCVPAGHAGSSRVDALLAFYIGERSAPVPAVEDAAISPGLPPVLEAELAEFSAGIGGLCPTAEAVRIARVLSEAAVRYVPHPEITVDIDGELSFDLRLRDSRLVFAELGLDARIDVGVYGPDDQLLVHDAEATCAYLLSVIES